MASLPLSIPPSSSPPPRDPLATLPTPGHLEALERVARLSASAHGVPPAQLQAFVDLFMLRALMGASIGLGVFAAQRAWAMVQGQLAMAAETIVALAKRSPECVYFRLISSSPDEATYETLRRGDPEPTRQTYTLRDAQRAGLASRKSWQLYPAAMLRARCASALGRAVYPDAVEGIDAVEEFIPPAIPGTHLAPAEDVPHLWLPPATPSQPPAFNPPPTTPETPPGTSPPPDPTPSPSPAVPPWLSEALGRSPQVLRAGDASDAACHLIYADATTPGRALVVAVFDPGTQPRYRAWLEEPDEKLPRDVWAWQGRSPAATTPLERALADAIPGVVGELLFEGAFEGGGGDPTPASPSPSPSSSPTPAEAVAALETAVLESGIPLDWRELAKWATAQLAAERHIPILAAKNALWTTGGLSTVPSPTLADVAAAWARAAADVSARR